MSSAKSTTMELAESLVAFGRKQGASEIEIRIEEGSRFSVTVRDGEVEKLVEAGTRELRLQVLVDGKSAVASSSDLSSPTLSRLIDNAIARARLGGSDPFAGLPELEELRASAEELRIYDPAILEMTPEQKIAYAKKVETTGLKQHRVAKSLGVQIRSGELTRTVVNSKGFRGTAPGTLVSAIAGFQAGEGDNLFQDMLFEGGTSIDKLPDAEELAVKAAQRVTRLVGARKVATQKVPVVIEPTVTASLLLGMLSRCVNGQAIDRGQSLLVDRLGEQIANDKVTIIDDGLLPGGFNTRPFDREGVPQRTTPVIDRGVLRSYLLNTYYGRKLGLGSTGNATGTTNLYWAAGSSTPEEIISSVDRGLLLTGTIGLGQDATTGDISIGAFGLWIDKGELSFPVAEVTIAANLADILQGVEMVGNDLRFLTPSNGPTVKVAEMTIGGSGNAE